MADKRPKEIKIKTGVVKRYTKEYHYYYKELEKEETRMKKFEAEGDTDRFKQQRNVIDETKNMIPDTLRRMKTSRGELQEMLDNEKDLKDIDEYKEAEKIIGEANEAESKHDIQVAN